MRVDSVCQNLGCSRAELARRLKVSKSLITIWAKNQNIPIGRQYQINDLLAGYTPLGVEPYHTPESSQNDGDPDSAFDAQLDDAF